MVEQSRGRNWTRALLLIIRFMIGWHLLYEGIFKLYTEDWSAFGYLSEARWIFSGLADWIISNPGVLQSVDFLNTWGLIAIGAGLILGLFTRPAAIAGFALLMLYYLFNPPLIGIIPAGPQEGNYMVVNKTLIEAFVLLLIAVTPAARDYGLDMLMKNRKKNQNR